MYIEKVYFVFSFGLLLKFCKNFNRMKGKKEKLLKEAVKELEQGISLVKAPSVLQQDPSLTLPKIKVKVSQQQSEENHAMEE